MNIFKLIRPFFDRKVVKIIDNSYIFKNSLEELSRSDEISVDTEFYWRNTYLPRLDLIQISNDKCIYLFDCKNLDQLGLLNEIFNSNYIAKIFHASRSDMSVLNKTLQSSFNCIFDVQLAEKLLTNDDQKSYQYLVKKYSLINLKKDQTTSDWNHRPLSVNQIKYAADDVRYLQYIKDQQLNQLNLKGKLDDFQDECENEIKLSQAEFAITRLKKYLKKNKNASKREKEIFLWRENLAEFENIPPSHIVKDKFLKKINSALENNAFKELDWIIRNKPYREKFLIKFK